MSTTENLIQRATTTTPLALAPLNATSLRDQAYTLIKAAIADTFKGASASGVVVVAR
jgi:hypothetical protein